MKKDKYLSLALFVAFSFLGTYLLHDSLHDTGPYAGGAVIVGAMFCSLALASSGVGRPPALDEQGAASPSSPASHLTFSLRNVVLKKRQALQ
jgi:hypothetical protein